MMRSISKSELLYIMPTAVLRADVFVLALNFAMEKFEIDTPKRVAAFLAQIAHESGELRYMEEIASGAAYEGRKDLGNIHPGDGVKFKGRGPIQITGRANYLMCSRDLYGDERLLESPEYLSMPLDGCMSAAWFWGRKNLNDLADAGDFIRITKLINGGLNGLEQRQMYHKRAIDIIK